MSRMSRTLVRGMMKAALKRSEMPRPSKHVSRLYQETRGTTFEVRKNKHGQNRLIEKPIEDYLRKYKIDKKGKVKA